MRYYILFQEYIHRYRNTFSTHKSLARPSSGEFMVVAFLFARSLCVAPNSIADRICALPIINQNKCACSHSVVVVCRQRNPLLATEEPRRAVGRVRMYGEHAIFIIYGLAAIRWVAFYVCLFSSVCTRIYTFLPPPVSLYATRYLDTRAALILIRWA